MIEVGQTIPKFSLTSDSNKTVTQDDLKNKNVILYFYPKDDTPGCTKEACGFRDHHQKLKKKSYVVIGVSKDSIASHLKFKAKYELPFMLLSDPENTLTQAIGAWGEKNMYGKKTFGVIRSTLILKNGVVEKVYKNVKAAIHPDEVLEEI